jgi:hypothetical protein
MAGTRPAGLSGHLVHTGRVDHNDDHAIEHEHPLTLAVRKR